MAIFFLDPYNNAIIIVIYIQTREELLKKELWIIPVCTNAHWYSVVR